MCIIYRLCVNICLLIFSNSIFFSIWSFSSNFPISNCSNLCKSVSIFSCILFWSSCNFKGKILETDPKKGTTIKEGDVVKLTISKGKYIVIDDYIGMDEEKATKALDCLLYTSIRF